MIALLVLKTAATIVCARKGLAMVAAVLSAGVVAEVLRAMFAHLRLGYAKPYTGAGFALWLPEVVLFLLPAAALVGVVWRRDGAAALWCIAAGYVALAYPALSGAALLAYYQAAYAMTSGVAVAVLVERALRRPITRDEAVVLCLALVGLADVALITRYGMEEWWATTLPNGAAYLAAILAAWTSPAPPRQQGAAAPPELVAAH